ncbi:YciI family protein [Intrasporangium mesophilum]
MKYVILIHSNPQPWGHPTGEFVAEHQALPASERERLNADFETLLAELSSSGELKGGEALGAPSDARLFRWDGGMPVATDGPYAESKEHLAGFFLVDVASRERAEQIATTFTGPGETVELRPCWTDEDEERLARRR